MNIATFDLRSLPRHMSHQESVNFSGVGDLIHIYICIIKFFSEILNKKLVYYIQVSLM
jgi:hypothetical protein